jgi:hypothetical protein
MREGRENGMKRVVGRVGSVLTAPGSIHNSPRRPHLLEKRLSQFFKDASSLREWGGLHGLLSSGGCAHVSSQQRKGGLCFHCGSVESVVNEKEEK